MCLVVMVGFIGIFGVRGGWFLLIFCVSRFVLRWRLMKVVLIEFFWFVKF